ARERFLLVAQAGTHRERIADLPFIFDEEGGVALGRLPRRRQARAADVIDLAEVRIGQDVDGRAGGGLLSVRRGERRPRVLLLLTELEALEVEAVAELMLAVGRHDVGR